MYSTALNPVFRLQYLIIIMFFLVQTLYKEMFYNETLYSEMDFWASFGLWNQNPMKNQGPAVGYEKNGKN